MTLEEKLQHLQTSVIEDARTQGNHMLEEHKNKLNHTFSKYKQEKLRNAKLTVETETLKQKRILNKTLAKEQLHARKKLTKKSTELKELLFQEVEQLLDEYKKTPEYKELLVQKIIAARRFAKDCEIRIYIDPSDEQKQKELETKTQAAIQVSTEPFGGGIRAVIPAKKILIDESFKTKMKESFEAFSFSGGSSHD